MKKRKETGLDFKIDKLTNSIENLATGEIFDTEIVRLTETDVKQIKETIGNLIGIRNLRT